MNVRELIMHLTKIEDKEMEVFGVDEHGTWTPINNIIEHDIYGDDPCIVLSEYNFIPYD